MRRTPRRLIIIAFVLSLGPANGIPTAGTTVTLMPFISGYQLNMKVTLASRPAPS